MEMRVKIFRSMEYSREDSSVGLRKRDPILKSLVFHKEVGTLHGQDAVSFLAFSRICQELHVKFLLFCYVLKSSRWDIKSTSGM
jgi:hypothetical protein